jgi:hypothetical protein
LAAKYGPNVNYAEGEHQHVRAEFAFDINDIAKHRLAPEKYLNHVGFAVPVPLLTRAFYDTYGLDLAKVLKNGHPKLRGYRYAVRTLLPRVAYAETLLYRNRMPPARPWMSFPRKWQLSPRRITGLPIDAMQASEPICSLPSSSSCPRWVRYRIYRCAGRPLQPNRTT